MRDLIAALAGPMQNKKPSTIKEYLFWSYATLGMAHAAISDNAHSYNKIHYMIRNKLYSGLINGTMNLGSLKEDERLKLIMPHACCYCGEATKLTLEHLIPLSKCGKDIADNIVWACKSCNSSKGSKDMFEWHQRIGLFPSLLLIRRYLKLVIEFCISNELIESSMDNMAKLPFSLESIPLTYPELNTLKLWIVPLKPA